jgi:uncharacterized membrane protein YbhN (UPF0104 family)
VWDLFVKLSTPLLAVAWLSTQQPIGPGLIQAAVAGGALFVAFIVLATMVLAGPATVASVGRLLERIPAVGDDLTPRLARLRQETLGLLATRWRHLTFWTVAGHANLFLLLVLCLRAVGVTSSELSAAAVLAAFAFGRLVTAVPLTPGGLGVMEVGLVGALSQVGEAPSAAIVAAVVLFRFATFALPIPLGAVAWLAWSTRAVSPVPALSGRADPEPPDRP